jgi:zinc transport system substrate-binding protein
LQKTFFNGMIKAYLNLFTINYSMTRFFSFFAICLTFFLNSSCIAAAAIPLVLVSVAPHKFFVEKIAGETVQVQLMVPAGASSHTYEPTPRQMMTASEAILWFIIGESFENRAVNALKSHRPAFRTVNLQEGVHLIESPHHHGKPGCCPGHVDLHFWLSAREAQIQAATIAKTLTDIYPAHALLYQQNLEAFQQELENLDQEITKILKPLQNRHILVSHPAYAYFCRDYDLAQYSIEVEGKDPMPQQMTKLLSEAKRLKASTIYIQMQYNNKAAKLVAETLKLKLVTLDPYAEQYLTAMREIAHAFAKDN